MRIDYISRLFFTLIFAFALTYSAYAQKTLWEFRPTLPSGSTRVQTSAMPGIDSPLYLGSSGVCSFQAVFCNDLWIPQKTILFWISSRGTLIGSIELDAFENILGLAQISGNSISFYIAKPPADPMTPMEEVFLKSYRANNGVVQLTKSTKLSGVTRWNMKLFPPQSTTSGGAIAWGYDDPTNYTGFWIRRYSP